jgi:uncharacterized protein YecT (DUF1311 family)
MIAPMNRLLALPFLLLAAPAAAEEPETAAVAPADRTTISSCVSDAGAGARSCIGSIAVVCARQAAGDRREAEVECSRREEAVWRERLDAAGRVLMQRLDSGARSRFVSVQRAWEAYASQKCAFMGDVQPAGRAPAMHAGCDLSETAERAIEVERLARRQAAEGGGPRPSPRPRIER